MVFISERALEFLFFNKRQCNVVRRVRLRSQTVGLESVFCNLLTGLAARQVI